MASVLGVIMIVSIAPLRQQHYRLLPSLLCISSLHLLTLLTLTSLKFNVMRV